MEAILRFIEQRKLRREFKNQTDLYCVEPLVKITYCWNEVEDIPNMEKSTTIYFEQLKEKQFFAKIYNLQKETYWEMYIVGDKEIQKVYLETRMMNPVKKKDE